MKILLSLCFAALAIAPAQAQVFRSGVSHRSHEHRDHGRNTRTSIHVGIGYSHGGYWGHAARPYYAGHRHYGYYSPRVYYSPYYEYYGGYGYDYPYYSTGYYGTSGAANGLALGAIAGGIIGHNSGEFRHNGWRGAAWGAGLGWLLGTIADANRRPAVYNSPTPVMVAPQVATVQAPPAAPAQQPQQVTIINNYYNSSPMSSANALFGR